MIQTITDYLDPGWVGSVIGILGIVVGILVGAFFYVRARQVTRLSWQYAGLHVIGRSADWLGNKIEVRFQGEPVPRLTLTKVLFWNSGTTTIRASDVVAGDPLRIAFGSNVQVLDAFVEACSRSANSVAVSLGPDGVALLGLDFLDPGDGARVAIVHAGFEVRPRLAGTVRGMPRGWEDRGSQDRQRRWPNWPLLVWTAFAGGMLAFTKWKYGPFATILGTGLATATMATFLEWVRDRGLPPALNEDRVERRAQAGRRCVTCIHRQHEHAEAPPYACDAENCNCKAFYDASRLPSGERPPWNGEHAA